MTEYQIRGIIGIIIMKAYWTQGETDFYLSWSRSKLHKCEIIRTHTSTQMMLKAISDEAFISY